MYPTDELFSRQQVVKITGMSDDLLSHWMREGLLRSSVVSSDGKRRRRRFSFVQLHVAVILKELHRYGTNIDRLHRLASVLQRSIVAGEYVGGHDWTLIIEAMAWAKDRDLPEEERTGAYVDEEGKFAASPSHAVIEAAERFAQLPSDEAKLVRVYEELVTREHLRWPEGDIWFWDIAAHDDRDWEIFGADNVSNDRDALVGLTSHLSINISMLIHRLWNPRP